MNKFLSNLKKKAHLVILIGIPAIFIVACDSGTSTIPASPNYCNAQINNFSSVSGLSLESALPIDLIWGPSLANLPFPANLEVCQSSVSWQQQRVLAAADYWVSQKVNYCHHHVPTWYPESGQGNMNYNPDAVASFESCSTNTDIMPPVPAESNIRWNYSGVESQTAAIWSSPNALLGINTGNYGYGLDCSDYTKLNYAYAESIYFTSVVALQGGQESSESNLAPNMPGFVDSAQADNLGLYSAGRLVCADGTVAPPRGTANSTSCNGHGGYISVFNSSGQYVESAITNTMLNNLQPGDLLYIAGCGSDPFSSIDPNCSSNPRQEVTHVVIWTGQQIGSSSWISNSMIAPQTDTDVAGSALGQCGTASNPDWWSVQNNIGNWIITDSHYQGPDFRAFTNCFYRNQVWGVRRVLGGYQ